MVNKITNPITNLELIDKTNEIIDNILDYYGTCSTSASTQTKVVVCPNFVLKTGASIRVKFSNQQNYNGQPNLNVNSTGVIPIITNNDTAAARYYWLAGEVVAFTYDGTNWIMEDGAVATTTYFGLTKLYTGVTSNTAAYSLTPRSLMYYIRDSLVNYPVYSSSATYAVGDRVRYNYNSWECNTAITTAEAWTAEHWTVIPTLQEQIDNKQDTLVSGTNIKTINNESILGSGNITIQGGSSGLSYTATCPAIALVGGVATWSVTHNLGTQAVITQLYSSSGDKIEHNTIINSNNAVSIYFSASSAVSAGDYTIVILASGADADTSNLAAKDFSNVSNFLPSGTIITVGTSGADFTTLADAFSYLSGKWSDGYVTISITTDLVITDGLELITSFFNMSLLVIHGNNHTITLDFTTANTYTCGFRIYNQNPVQVRNVNFVGGTNGSTHILAGGYHTTSLLFSNCSFDNAYAGLLAYNVANVKAEGCTFLALTVGMQAQQGGTLASRGCTFGASGKKCTTCLNVYLGGIVRDGESTYTNYGSYAGQTVNTITTNGIIMKA